MDEIVNKFRENRFPTDTSDCKWGELLEELLLYVKPIRASLEEYVGLDSERCRFDRHGACQEHSIGIPCHVAVARKALGLTHSPIMGGK